MNLGIAEVVRLEEKNETVPLKSTRKATVVLGQGLSVLALLELAVALLRNQGWLPWGKEMDQHRGWGHSSYEEAVALAVEVKAKHLVLFHHRPERDDAAMDELVDAARSLAEAAEHPLEVSAAIEGTELTLDGG